MTRFIWNRAEDLLQIDNSLNEDDIWQFKYPNDSIIKTNSIRGIYLSNYFGGIHMLA